MGRRRETGREYANAYSFFFIVSETFLGLASGVFMNVTVKTPLSIFLPPPKGKKRKKETRIRIVPEEDI
jgi:hypothetical protein